MAALYLHSPFCSKICPYCDFAVLVAPQRVKNEWRKSLLLEAQQRMQEDVWNRISFDTLYFGGGTPSLLGTEELTLLFSSMSKVVKIDLHEMQEVTIEANPESVSEEKIELWKELGFSRVSLGLQSLQDQTLKAIGRNHDRATALRSLSLLKESSLRWSADLMFALPRQKSEQFLEDLRQLLDFGIQHISFYGLGIEPQTLLGQQSEKGLIAVDEEIYRDSYLRGAELCAAYGLERYEISNFSVKGEESLHNRSYWRRTPYLGLGPGAHSYDGERLREANHKQFLKWSHSVQSGEIRWREEDHLGARELANEELWLSLRQSKGMTLRRLQETGFDVERLDQWIQEGTIKVSNDHLLVVGEGWLLIDEICSTLFM